MTDDAIIRAIAEDRGWKPGKRTSTWTAPSGPRYIYKRLPQWLGPDHNAAHKLIEVLRGEGWDWIAMSKGPLVAVEFFNGNRHHTATAATFSRATAEAYLRVRVKWKG